MNLQNQMLYNVNYKLVGKSFLAWQRKKGERNWSPRPASPESLMAPPLKSMHRMKELISRQYMEGHYVEGVRKVAWVVTGTPVEVLQALGYYIYYPENHSAIVSVRGMMEEVALNAEETGYSRDICSYVRTDMGSILSGLTAVGKVPKPDLLMCSNAICQTALHWHRVLAEHFKVPLYVFDTPFLYGESEAYQVEYLYKQIQDMIPVAEKIAGKSLSWKKLQEVTRIGKETSEVWMEIQDRAQTRPAPISAFDAFISMGPIVALRGEPGTLEFYQQLLAEVDERIENGVGVVLKERKRVLWDNLPIWHRLGWLARLLARHGVTVAVSNYTYAWGELAPMMDPEHPLESAARVYLHPILNRSTSHKMEAMEKMVKDFHLDGVILHSDRSCKPYSIGQMDQRDRLMKTLNVPALLLESDHNDPRIFSEKQVTTRLEAFAEMLN